LIGAHRDKEGAAKALGDYFLNAISEMQAISSEERMEKRYARLTSHGAYTE
jgi:acetyl-CoA carboxylase carboxyl transferase subunit alpha